MNALIIATMALGGLALGAIITYFILTKVNQQKAEQIVKEAEEKAEMIKKDKILQAK